MHSGWGATPWDSCVCVCVCVAEIRLPSIVHGVYHGYVLERRWPRLLSRLMPSTLFFLGVLQELMMDPQRRLVQRNPGQGAAKAC